MQLLLFKEIREACLESRIDYLEKQIDKYRKKQFAKIGELVKLYKETQYELETLKLAMCRSVKHESTPMSSLQDLEK